MGTGVVGGPAAWTAADMRASAEWVHQLEAVEVQELVDAAGRVAAAGVPRSGIALEDFPVPALAGRLERVLDEVADGRGFALIRGVPVDTLGRPEIEAAYWLIGLHLGIPIRQNDAGETLVRVTDEGLSFDQPTVRGYQTRDRLDFHSDSSDLVALLCIRPARKGGESRIVSGVTIHDEMVRRHPDLAAVGHRPYWFDRRRADESTSFFPCPLFGLTPAGGLAVYYGRAHIESAQRGAGVPRLTREQLEALDLFDSLASDERLALDMDFRPGDIQILNNHLILHARTSYEDWPEPDRRRELLRLWLTLRRPVSLPPEFEAAGIVRRDEAFGPT